MYENRLYHEPPCPDSRLVSDHISELTSSIKYSLSGGLLKRRRFDLTFQRNIFNFLFKESKGKKAKNKPGKLYERNDFPPHYFSDSAFTYYNKDGEGCFVLFPVYMHSKIKYGPLHYDINGRTCIYMYLPELERDF